MENNAKKFELLKQLLLADEREDLRRLREEILEYEKFNNKVNPIIDEKIAELRRTFPEEFGGTITETIKVQITESQDDVVEALYPILGKLVKKFIIAEVAKLSDNINQTISSTFSPKQIFKRFMKGESTSAGVVLQEVFEPTIEEVFIIEKDSGLLIGSYSRGNIADKDMVSGMLTAIKSFAEDAFHKEAQDLEDIKFETFQLSMMNYKSVYIATATSGMVNQFFKDTLYDQINELAEKILRNRNYLSNEKMLNELIEATLFQEEYVAKRRGR